MDDLIEFVVIALIPIVLFGGAIFGIAVGVEAYSCRTFSQATGIETKYNFGCYALLEGKWVPKEYVYGNAGLKVEVK